MELCKNARRECVCMHACAYVRVGGNGMNVVRRKKGCGREGRSGSREEGSECACAQVHALGLTARRL